MSTTTDSYKQWPIDTERVKPKAREYNPVPEDRDFDTVSKQAYHEFDPAMVTKSVSAKPVPQISASVGAFGGNSTYKLDYPGHSAGPRQKYGPTSKSELRSLPFEGSTEYHDRYPSHNDAPPTVRAKRPAAQTAVAGHRFEGASTYAADFVEQPVEPHVKAGPRSSGRAHVANVPFEGHSSYAQDFVPLKSTRPIKHGPVVSTLAKAEPAKFQGVSTTTDSYKVWPLDVNRVKPKGREYSHVPDNRDFSTEYGKEFLDVAIEYRELKPGQIAPPGNVEIQEWVETIPA